ncbi:hypothetical protein ACHWQZ_G012335 [Mnemiopsis leidyi]
MTSEQSGPTWTRQDYLYLTLAMMIKFGDGVEIYLPGVITQKVSCELELSSLQEAFLAAILYAFQGISLLSAVKLASWFGERNVVLFSLYSSIVSTVFCAIVPNYYTFLLSRALIGMSCGLNSTLIGILCVKNISSKDILPKFSFLHASLAITLGGTWASLLGWLLLDNLGWRVFVLLTSIPIFIPPIFILHCYTRQEVDQEYSSESDPILDRRTEDLSEEIFSIRALKASLFMCFNFCIGYGSILLLPAIIKQHNLEADYDMFENCEEVVHGHQYLILTGMNGLANVLGRIIGYPLRSRVSFVVLQSIVMLGAGISYGIILTKPGLLVESTMMGIGKLCYSIQGVEVGILLYDVDYFGYSRVSLGSALMYTGGEVGALLSTFLAVIIESQIAVLVTLFVIVLQIVLIQSMRERK